MDLGCARNDATKPVLGERTFGDRRCWQQSGPRVGLVGPPRKLEYSRQIRSPLGNPSNTLALNDRIEDE